MSHGFTSTRAAVVIVALASAGCSLDITDPAASNPIEIKLDFCSNEVPIWFAHQNSNGPVTVVTPDANGTFTFTATRRATLAFVRQNGSDYKTEIIFTNNADLQQLSGLDCVEEAGTKQVNGTVSGLSGSQLALIGMSVSSVYLTANQTSFTLTQLVDRPLDLIASRVDVVGNEQNANKTIIRRTQNPTSGSTMSPIDFDAEGVVPVTNTASVDGVEPDAGFILNNFFSQLETSHTLSFTDAISSGSVPFVSIPSAQLAAGDYHDLFVVATNTAGGSRGIERFFKDPANQTMKLGPDLSEPIITVISAAADPYTRFQVQLAGQFEYSTMITMDFHQETTFSNTDVLMSVTASHFGGTPILWNLPMPNFSGLEGWNNSWGLQQGATDWTITGYFGPTRLVFGGKPADKDVVQFASRSSSINAAMYFRTSRAAPLRRHFSRLR